MRCFRQRVVALATLAGAVDEAHAVELLRLVPDVATASQRASGTPCAMDAHALLGIWLVESA